MSTRATVTLQALAQAWLNEYPSARFSGILPDPDHLANGGYHVSIEDNPAGNYSITRTDDKAPPGDWPRDCAAAIDVSLALDDMKLCHSRLRAVWRDRTDPRAKYINAHNGWDGNGNAGRYDWVTGTVAAASDDHKWHVHLEIRRRYVNDAKAAAAVLSILRGETLDDYLGDDMTPAQYLTLLNDEKVAARFGQLTRTGVWDAAVWGGADAPAAKVAYQRNYNTLQALIAKVDALDAKVAQLRGEFDEIPAEVLAALRNPDTPDQQVASALLDLLGDRAAAVLPLMHRQA